MGVRGAPRHQEGYTCSGERGPQGAPTSTHIAAQRIAQHYLKRIAYLPPMFAADGAAAADAAGAEGAAGKMLPAAAAAAACGVPSQLMQTANNFCTYQTFAETIPKNEESPLLKKAPPPPDWLILQEGKLLKRFIAMGEGEETPSISCNCTLLFSVFSSSGLKLLTNKSMGVEYLEMPIKNAAPGVREALLTMRLNERAAFLLSPSLFYPDNTSPLLLPIKETAAAKEAETAAESKGPLRGPLNPRGRLPLEHQEKIKLLQQKMLLLQQQQQQQQQQQLEQYDDASVLQLTGKEWLM
ncbi:hypothetical protein, conserved [Eimeria acervulina]|uniref:Peptidylprolyl isomerase n=1 Tax=Eimeria acervulina TaxID=5801 RepID=U6GUX4_EIMAC|nr:hypothetical protein, conserved [Eimeria acervulina]CDI84026.1 hypothetical protein, conserved [Eimeria acervulina]